MWIKRRKPKEELLFDQLCEDYYEKVLRYLYCHLGEESAARDVVQEVFLTAWQKRDALAEHPNPGGFLFQTAKNLLCKQRRQAFARMAKEFVTEDGELPPAAGDGIEELLDSRVDEHDFVEEALSRLDPEKRRLYELHYLSGKPMKEIAGDLGMEETTVRMRYVRLRREIRAIVSQVAEEKFSF